MKMPFLIIILSILMTLNVHAEISAFGLQCSGTDTNELKSCLKKESGKIDEANHPNEIILQSDDAGKESLLKLIRIISEKKSNDYTVKLQALVPLIESSVATALIIQYEKEPQLYFYAVDKNGKLEVIFDGMNSVDISEIYGDILKSEPEVLSLKSPTVSKLFTDWLESLKD
ncbi:MAG: hypothetical protein H7177_13120 [Rhizobacter sp.]|nr:hypothetical protein [Bacteriovorax sp.]